MAMTFSSCLWGGSLSTPKIFQKCPVTSSGKATASCESIHPGWSIGLIHVLECPVMGKVHGAYPKGSIEKDVENLCPMENDLQLLAFPWCPTCFVGLVE